MIRVLKRTEVLGIRMSRREKQALARVAAGKARTLSDWARLVLLREARRKAS